VTVEGQRTLLCALCNGDLSVVDREEYVRESEDGENEEERVGWFYVYLYCGACEVYYRLGQGPK
jgi:uncharacterized protein YbaR (Trm112 family)